MSEPDLAAAFIAHVARSGNRDDGYHLDDAYREFLKPLRKAELASLAVELARWFADHLAADYMLDDDEVGDMSVQDALDRVAAEMCGTAGRSALEEEAQP